MASNFGTVTDYFGLESSTLIAESSEDGANKQHVCAYNATSEAPATATSGIWLNPSVTYRVVGDMTLALKLGKAFAKSTGKSGYMITSVAIETSVGEAPSITVTGTANEGKDAVKTYNISIPLLARHRPQNISDAVTLNGYHLQTLSMTATCDPVVLAEDGMPCASDVCHGHIEVTASLADYGDATAYSAGTGFTITGEKVGTAATEYKKVTINLRKDLT